MVDPISCEGVGLCAHLAPEVVRLDPWGFPIMPRGDVVDVAAARRAVRGCPRRALRLTDAPSRTTGAMGILRSQDS